MRLIYSSLLIALLLIAPMSWAEEVVPHRNERDYIIELLVFTQHPGEGATEQPGPAKIFQPLEEPAYRLGPAPFWTQLSRKPLPAYQSKRHQLGRIAYALNQSDDYRLLYHDAWQMPVVGEDRTLPLLLEAGDYYAGQPELMGQLRLSVARYLHLETDLYLHTFEALPEQHRANSLNQFLQTNHSALDTASSNLSSQITQVAADPDEQLSQLVRKDYQIKESAQMQQRRRMRSGELHFIDSPYLGLLIRIERAPES